VLDPRARGHDPSPQQSSPQPPADQTAGYQLGAGYFPHAGQPQAGYPQEVLARFPQLAQVPGVVGHAQRFVLGPDGLLRPAGGPPRSAPSLLRRLLSPRRLAPVVAVLLVGVLTADLVVLSELTGREDGVAAEGGVAARQDDGRQQYVAATRNEPGGAVPTADGDSGTGTAASGTVSPQVAPLRRLREPHLFVVANRSLSAKAVRRVRRVKGVATAEVADAAEVMLDGKRVHTMGVNPSTFRAYTPKITAESDALWANIAGGDVAVSFVLGRDGGVKLGSMVDAGGRRLRVGAWATVGIGSINAIVSRQTARSLGFPRGNALVVSAPEADSAQLRRHLLRVLPKGTQVVTINPVLIEPDRPTGDGGSGGGASGNAGNTGNAGDARGGDESTGERPAGGEGGSGDGGGAPEQRTDVTTGSLMSAEQIQTVLNAAASKLGRPYVWGAAGPDAFDCSGLVQWAFAQAGVRMPRVTDRQWATGPKISLSEAQPGDLLFWRRDPTNPGYISHVAIYWGDGKMLHAPRTGDVVKIAPIPTEGFAGVVRVDPQIAARVR